MDTAIVYINKDGVAFWAEFLDSTFVITGGTGSYFTGGTVTGPTNFLNGVTASTISASTYYGLPTDVVVTGGTYYSGTILFTNNTGGTFTVTGLTTGGSGTTVIQFTGGTVTGATNFTGGVSANTISATTYVNLPKILNGGSQIYYFNLSETEGSYHAFKSGFSTALEQDTTVSVSSGNTDDIAGFLTMNTYPNSPILPGGLWSFYLNIYKEDSISIFNVFCEIYKVNQSNTETFLFSTETTSITSVSPIPSTVLLYTYFDGTTIDVDDRILVKVKATNNGASTKTITLVSEGSQNYSYCISSFSLSIDDVVFDGGYW